MDSLDLKKLDGNLTIKGRRAGLPSAQYINRMLDKVNELVSGNNSVLGSIAALELADTALDLAKMDKIEGTPGTPDVDNWVSPNDNPALDQTGLLVLGENSTSLAEVAATTFTAIEEPYPLSVITTADMTALWAGSLDGNDPLAWHAALFLWFTISDLSYWWDRVGGDWTSSNLKIRFYTDNGDGSFKEWEASNDGEPTLQALEGDYTPVAGDGIYMRLMCAAVDETGAGISGNPALGTLNYNEGAVTGAGLGIAIGGGDSRLTTFITIAIPGQTAGVDSEEYVKITTDSDGDETYTAVSSIPASVSSVDDSNFTNLSATNAQLLFEEIDPLLAGGASGEIPSSGDWPNIYYVDGAASAGGDGTAESPFDTLLAALTAADGNSSGTKIILLSDAKDILTPIDIPTVFGTNHNFRIMIEGINGKFSSGDRHRYPTIPQFTFNSDCVLFEVYLKNVRLEAPVMPSDNGRRFTSMTMRDVQLIDGGSNYQLNAESLDINGLVVEDSGSGSTFHFRPILNGATYNIHNFYSPLEFQFGVTGSTGPDVMVLNNVVVLSTFGISTNNGNIYMIDSTGVLVIAVAGTGLFYSKGSDAWQADLSASGGIFMLGEPLVKFQVYPSAPTDETEAGPSFGHGLGTQLYVTTGSLLYTCYATTGLSSDWAYGVALNEVNLGEPA